MLSLCFEGLGLVDIDPRHQPVKLPPGKIPDLRLLPGPLIAAMDRQPLVDQNKAIRFTEQSFDPVPSSSTEKEESTGRRIHLKLVFDNGAESVNGFPHIGIAADNVDLLKPGDITCRQPPLAAIRAILSGQTGTSPAINRYAAKGSLHE